GGGYPRRLAAEQLSVPARIMAIADIFEALTAADRPYKAPKTLSESIRIMVRMAREQHIDAELLALFLSSGVYLTYAHKYLHPEQLDEVVVPGYLEEQRQARALQDGSVSVAGSQEELGASGLQRTQAGFAEGQIGKQLRVSGPGQLPRAVALQISAQRLQGGHAGAGRKPGHILDTPGQPGFTVGNQRAAFLRRQQSAGLGKLQRRGTDKATQRGDAQGAEQCVQTVQMFGKLLQCSAVQLEMTLFQRGESQGGQVALHGRTMGQRLWYLLAPCLANRAGGPDPMSPASHRREPGTG